ncbi:hypothetical protein J7643_13150 [bacterium]|nr:hypothetical protein [bacterium]
MTSARLSALAFVLVAIAGSSCATPTESTTLARSTPQSRLIAQGKASAERDFSADNWSLSVKRKDRLQVYIAETPDWYQVVEQELPRSQRDFNTLKEAMAYANRQYADWPLISLDR